MKKLLVVFCCVLLIQCGNERNESEGKYQSSFFNCLEKEETEIIEKGVAIFNSALRDYLKIQGEISTETYKNYFDAAASWAFSRQFYKNQQAIDYLNALRQNSSFQKMYTTFEDLKKEYEKVEVDNAVVKLEELEEEIIITPRTDEEEIREEEIPNFYVLDPKSAFVNCLLAKSENKDLRNYIESIQLIGDISPGVKCFSLIDLIDKIEKETDKDIFMALAAFDIYFGSIFMFNKFE
jgi:hypothetical protein